MIWIAISALMGVMTDTFLQKHLALQKRPVTFLLSLLSSLMLSTVFADPALILKGCLFAQCLILAGYFDYKTHEIPDTLLIPTALCGLINMQLFSSLEGAAFIFLIMLADLLLTNAIGGGDVKFLSACAFTLGLYSSLGAGLICFFLFFLVSKLLKRKGYYPLGPYIGLGCYLAFLLN